MPFATASPAAAASSAFGTTPTLTSTRSALQPLAAGQFDMVDPAVMAGDAHRLRAEAELDAGAAMRLGEEMRGRDGEHPAHDPVGQFDDVHRLAVGARDGGEFEADKTGADHHDLLGRGEVLAQSFGLGQVAQIAHAVELDARERRHPVARAGGEHEVAVFEVLAGAEAHRCGRRGRSR